MAEDNSAAWPQADQALSQEILDLVQQYVCRNFSIVTLPIHGFQILEYVFRGATLY
jgi:hypothetical protein